MIESQLVDQLWALFGVVLIDVVLAGDNAVVVGAAASGLSASDKRKVIIMGLGVALACRIAFALVALQLLKIIGLMLAGGILLVWVAWKMWRDLRARDVHDAGGKAGRRKKTVWSAFIQVAVADVSMSLDNVLAVAGVARAHAWTMIFGLFLSVALVGVAANIIATFMERQRWIGYVGVFLVFCVAVRMIWDGSHQVAGAIANAG